MIRIMLDLETLGTRPGAAITAIGAVAFKGPRDSCNQFYQTIDLKSAVECGLKIDADAVLWWMKQSNEARAEFSKESKGIGQVFMDFRAWIEQFPADTEIWGNGSDFDNVLLAEAYQILGYPVPWNFRQNRCYRTMRKLFHTIPFSKPDNPHNALEDAIAQAVHLMRIINHAISFGCMQNNTVEDAQ